MSANQVALWYLVASVCFIFALKGLEGIGDHATNVAEQVLYMLGKDGGSAAAA